MRHALQRLWVAKIYDAESAAAVVAMHEGKLSQVVYSNSTLEPSQWTLTALH